jgi:hypothetical protein
MRKIDKLKNYEQANLMLEQSYLKSKNFLNEDSEILEEGLQNFLYDAFKKIRTYFEVPEIEKIKNQFNKDLPTLVAKVGNVNTKELNTFVKNINQNLPSVIEKTINESLQNKEILIEEDDKNSDTITINHNGKSYTIKRDVYEKRKKALDSLKKNQSSENKVWEKGVSTVGGEKVEDNKNILDKIKDIILGLFNFAATSSLFYLLWKVVIEWWIGHRAMIPLELGIWGKVSLIILLITTLAYGIYHHFGKQL